MLLLRKVFALLPISLLAGCYIDEDHYGDQCLKTTVMDNHVDVVCIGSNEQRSKDMLNKQNKAQQRALDAQKNITYTPAQRHQMLQEITAKQLPDTAKVRAMAIARLDKPASLQATSVSRMTEHVRVWGTACVHDTDYQKHMLQWLSSQYSDESIRSLLAQYYERTLTDAALGDLYKNTVLKTAHGDDAAMAAAASELQQSMNDYLSANIQAVGNLTGPYAINHPAAQSTKNKDCRPAIRIKGPPANPFDPLRSITQ